MICKNEIWYIVYDMSHIWMPFYIYEWVMSHVWMIYSIWYVRKNEPAVYATLLFCESFCLYDEIYAYIYIYIYMYVYDIWEYIIFKKEPVLLARSTSVSPVTSTNESCHKNEWVMSRILTMWLRMWCIQRSLQYLWEALLWVLSSMWNIIYTHIYIYMYMYLYI